MKYIKVAEARLVIVQSVDGSGLERDKFGKGNARKQGMIGIATGLLPAFHAR